MKKLPKIKTVRNKCDALLTPIVKKMYPRCESCGKPTEVGHHWIEKSRSSNLRYNLENIIPLCTVCHTKIHNRFGSSVVGSVDVAQAIINKRGEEWKKRMDVEGKKIIKTDIHFYIDSYELLRDVYDSLY